MTLRCFVLEKNCPVVCIDHRTVRERHAMGDFTLHVQTSRIKLYSADPRESKGWVVVVLPETVRCCFERSCNAGHHSLSTRAPGRRLHEITLPPPAETRSPPLETRAARTSRTLPTALCPPRGRPTTASVPRWVGRDRTP